MHQEIKRKIHRASLLLVASMLLSRVIGFVREWVLAQTVGANQMTDVYLASFTIPDFLNHLMASGALSISFIPMLNEYLAQEKHEQAKRVFRALSTIMVGTLAVLIVIAEIWARPLASLVAPGFSESQLSLLTYLVRIILPAQLFFYWGGLAMSVQQTHGMFLTLALAPIVYNTGIILGGVLLHGAEGVAGFSYGVLAGSALGHGLLQWWALRRLGYPVTPYFRFDAEIRAALKRYVWLTVPIMFSFSLVVADEWISKNFASRLGDRAITWLSYARTEMRIPIAVIGQVAGIASFPFLAGLWSRRDYDGYARTLLREISKLWAAGPIAAIILVNHALPITHFIYGGGKLGMEDLNATAEALRVMGLGVFFWILQVVLARAFYASQRTWLPSILGTILCFLVLPLYSVMGTRWGHLGLALAGSLGIFAYCVVLVLWLAPHLRRHAPGVDYGRFWTFCGAWTLVLGGMAGLSWGVKQLGIYQRSQLSGLAEALVVAAVLGGLAILLLRKAFAKLTDGALY